MSLLDSHIRGWEVNLGYTIIRHMLTSLGVINRSLPYGSIIIEPAHVEVEKLRRGFISIIGFQR